MKDRPQCKDIPDRPILEFLAKLPQPANWGWPDETNPDSVRHAMPADIDDRLVVAKMRMLIRRGLVHGCGCGCRGDFEITAAGKDYLKSTGPQTET